MLKEYNILAQSQEIKTQYISTYADSLFQTVQEKLSKSAQRVLLELYGYRKMPIINPTQKRLACQSGYCTRQVRRAEKELEENNLISIKRPRGWNRRLIYTFRVPLQALGDVLRPIISAIYLSTKLLLCDADAREKNVPLLRIRSIKEHLKASPLTPLMASLVSIAYRRDAANKSQDAVDLKIMPKKEKRMRMIVNEVKAIINLSDPQLEMLDAYTDRQIQDALNRFSQRKDVLYPARYFMSILSGWHEDQQKRDVTQFKATRPNGYTQQAEQPKKEPKPVAFVDVQEERRRMQELYGAMNLSIKRMQ